MAEIGEIIRLTLRYSAPAASVMQNVFHFVVDVSTTTDQDVLDVLDAWASSDWSTAWDGIASEDVTLDDASVDVVNVDGTVVRAIGAFTIIVAGVLSGSVTSAGVASYVLLKTLFPKVKGVKYLPGIAEAAIQDGALTAGALATMAFVIIEYGTTLPAAGSTELVPGVPSKSKGIFVPFLDTGIITDIPAYQRRRKPNVGS